MKRIVGKNYEDMSQKAAEAFAERLPNIRVMGLATGSTPVGMYKALARMQQEGKISFADTSSVNLDEYIGLPEGHPETYRSFMNTQFFDHIDIDRSRTFVPKASSVEDKAACEAYDAIIDGLGGVDLQILGVGENGHIAFNEPAEELYDKTAIIRLTESTIRANSRFFPSMDDVPKYAISMGVGKIMAAKEIFLLATGAKKADAIRRLLQGETITTQCPVTLLKLHPNVTVFIDEELERAL